MRTVVDHVAVLTTDVERLRSTAPTWLRAGDIETFPSEGTAECYLRPTVTGAPSILLIEPVARGPYQRALDRRGAGLHHVAWVTDDLDRAVDRFVEIGVHIHDVTATTRATGTAWLYRSGLPLLVELLETSGALTPEPSMVRVEVPSTTGPIEPMPLPDVSVTVAEHPDLVLRVGSNWWTVHP